MLDSAIQRIIPGGQMHCATDKENIILYINYIAVYFPNNTKALLTPI